jgi:hypothetical protein
MRKREMKSSIDKRLKEIESYLGDKEKVFKLKKRSEVQQIVLLLEKE